MTAKPTPAETRQLVDRAVEGDSDALDAIVGAVQDDIYNLAMRFLGARADAEDATQEILVQIVTHLAQWRGEASFRTWCWRIATRALMRRKKSADEEAITGFETVEQLIEMGVSNPPLPDMPEAELAVLETELRIACTQGMLTALDRDQRISWVLAEVFELDGNEAADVLDVDAATHRKRLSRAQKKLGEWMEAHCGIVNPSNPCRCRRQIPVAMQIGAVDPKNLQFATHATRGPAKRTLPIVDAADEVQMAAYTLCCHPDYAAPATYRARIRDLISSGSIRMLS